VPRVTPTVVELGHDPTMVVAVALVTCQLMECRLGGTSVEHPSTIFRRFGQDPLSLLLLFIQYGSVGTLLFNHGTHKSIEQHVTKSNQVILKWEAQSFSE
jgi:hypothetical protein